MSFPTWITSALGGLAGKAVDAWDNHQERKQRIKEIEFQGQLEERKLKHELKAETTRAKIAIQQQKITHAQNWEIASIKNSGWKDEYITLVLTAPYIAVFIPYAPVQDAVMTGFRYIGQTPMWYQTLVVGVVSSALGIRLWGSIKQVQQVTGGKTHVQLEANRSATAGSRQGAGGH